MDSNIGVYALIDGDKVINTILWDGNNATWAAPEGLITALIKEGDGAVSIDWNYDGESFHPSV
jgi:hypothetical protein